MSEFWKDFTYLKRNKYRKGFSIYKIRQQKRYLTNSIYFLRLFLLLGIKHFENKSDFEFSETSEKEVSKGKFGDRS